MIKDIIKPGIVLLIIAMVAAALLGFVNEVTKDKIAEQERIAKEESMKTVLPEAVTFESEQKVSDSIIQTYAEGKDKDGNTVGYAFSISTKGFSTGLNLMIGIAGDRRISGIDVLSHEETPGLGANADSSSFTEQFKGKVTPMTVSKAEVVSGSEIHAITGATITSTAIANAVNTAVDYFDFLQGNADVHANSGATQNNDKGGEQ